MITKATLGTGHDTLAAQVGAVPARSLPVTATKALLLGGVLSGPFFFAVAIYQMFIRPGFDIRRHAISVLSLGDLGWIQIANFLITGALALGCAIALRPVLRGGRAGTWGPLLVGIYGLGMIVGGIFHPDPGLSFPPGAPAGMPASTSWHAAVHMLGFYAAFLALIAACFVFMRRFRSLGRRGWATYCAATGIVAPVLIVLGMGNKDEVGLLIAVAGACAFGLVSAVAARCLADLSAVSRA